MARHWHRCSRFWKQGLPCAYEGLPELHEGIRDPDDEDSPRASQPRTQEAISPEGLRAAEQTSKEALKDPKNKVIVKEVQKLWDQPPIIPPVPLPGRPEERGASPVFPQGVRLPSLPPSLPESLTAQEALRAYYAEANLTSQLSKSPVRSRQPVRSIGALGNLEEQYVRDFDAFRNTRSSGEQSKVGPTGSVVPATAAQLRARSSNRQAAKGRNLGDAVIPAALLAISGMAVGASFLSSRGRGGGPPRGGIPGMRGGGFQGFFNQTERMLALTGGGSGRSVNDAVESLGTWRRKSFQTGSDMPFQWFGFFT